MVTSLFEDPKNAELKKSLCGVSLTNQRETTICWDKVTGKPYYNALVWNDTRTRDIGLEYINRDGKDFIRKYCGLPINTYFSAVKMKWLMQNVEEIKEKISNNKIDDLCFGTIDSWIVYKYTGNFYTDVTNASRTMLMNIETCDWDEKLLDYFKIPRQCLPKIISSSDDFGKITTGCLSGIHITGVIGDQQSACIGHLIDEGEVKNTYGTGAFILMNTGNSIVHSKFDLLTTLLYKKAGEKPLFALEGAVEAAGSILSWLKNNLRMIKNFEELEEIFNSVEDNGGVYFGGGFSGLFTPHWDPNARGLIIGLSQHSTNGHIVRAIYEGISFRTLEIIQCFEKESGLALKKMKVDGGLTKSDQFLQTQANALQAIVEKPDNQEMTLLGSVIVAGLSEKSGIWSSFEEVKKIERENKDFLPKWDNKTHDEIFAKWREAINRSKNWA